MAPEISNRGRGPEIAGTRITIYDIMDYTRAGWSPSSIALLLRLSSDQVHTAVRYIEEHQTDVIAVHDRILARDAAGNPPEILAKLEHSRAKLQKLMSGHRAHAPEVLSAGAPG